MSDPQPSDSVLLSSRDVEADPGDEVIDPEVEMDLLRSSVRPFRPNVVRRMLHAVVNDARFHGIASRACAASDASNADGIHALSKA
jgi:hypothetical protein